MRLVEPSAGYVSAGSIPALAPTKQVSSVPDYRSLKILLTIFQALFALSRWKWSV